MIMTPSGASCKAVQDTQPSMTMCPDFQNTICSVDLSGRLTPVGSMVGSHARPLDT